MRVSPEDLALFYRLHPALLSYANRKLGVNSKVESVEAFMKIPIAEKFPIRNALYEHMELIDAFVEENPGGFTAEELQIIEGWKDAIIGRFYLARYLKKHTVMLDQGEPAKAYGVLSLTDELEEAFDGDYPIMLDTVLLPFKGQIIYDGMMSPYNVYFGSGIRESINAEYQEAKARYGIITSLPFQPPKGKESDADRLKLYLKNEANRDRYWDEIETLIEKNMELRTLYHQEMGKHAARTLGRRLREMGLKSAWFALLEGTVIAGGTAKEEAERVVKAILPEEKLGFVYYFHLKG